MSDTPSAEARPVSLLAVGTVLVLLAAFFVVVNRAYVRRQPAAPFNQALEQLPADQAWKATPESRRAALADLRRVQAAQASSYGWVDRKAGLVRIPVEQAMEAVVREYGTPSTP